MATALFLGCWLQLIAIAPGNLGKQRHWIGISLHICHRISVADFKMQMFAGAPWPNITYDTYFLPGLDLVPCFAAPGRRIDQPGQEMPPEDIKANILQVC